MMNAMISPFLPSGVKGQIVKRFIKLISYCHPVVLQFHRAAGEVRMYSAIHEGRQYDKMYAFMQRIAADSDNGR